MSAIAFPGAVRAGSKSKRRARVARRSSSISYVGIASFIGGVALLTFVFTQIFNLAGMLQVEKFRVAARASENRAAAATSGARELRAKVEHLRGSEKIQTWAALNGFKPSYAVSNETTTAN